MPRLIDHFPIALATGAQAFGPAAVANSMRTVTVRIARNTTAAPTLWISPDTTIDLRVEASRDDGATWEFV